MRHHGSHAARVGALVGQRLQVCGVIEVERRLRELNHPAARRCALCPREQVRIP